MVNGWSCISRASFRSELDRGGHESGNIRYHAHYFQVSVMLYLFPFSTFRFVHCVRYFRHELLLCLTFYLGKLIQDNESKEQSSIPNNDIDSSFWDFQAPSLANPRLASLKAMERFASDISAFTTITDSDSDSGDTTVEALPVNLKTIINS